jgi:hypothetical protein
MAALNENLILKVFAEMLKNKPSPSKHLPEIDEEIDYRIIPDLLIKTSHGQLVLNFGIFSQVLCGNREERGLIRFLRQLNGRFSLSALFWYARSGMI